MNAWVLFIIAVILFILLIAISVLLISKKISEMTVAQNKTIYKILEHPAQFQGGGAARLFDVAERRYQSFGILGIHVAGHRGAQTTDRKSVV